MIEQKRIVILVFYFGKLPWYFDYFIHSSRYNHTIDFLLITDTAHLIELPYNVKPIYKTLGDINKLASNKLGFETNINDGYKFCDFKPAYGFLFSEFIEGYDFWGQCDVDVIFGDIRTFMNEEVLNNIDFVSARHDFPTGCFMLFRNNAFMNHLFMTSRDYKKVLSSSKHFCFDECNNVHELLTQGASIFELKTEIESFMQVIKTAEKANGIKTLFDFMLIEGITGRLKFERGKLTYKNSFEVILYHLILFKKFSKVKAVPKKIPDRYSISPTRIYF